MNFYLAVIWIWKWTWVIWCLNFINIKTKYEIEIEFNHVSLCNMSYTAQHWSDFCSVMSVQSHACFYIVSINSHSVSNNILSMINVINLMIFNIKKERNSLILNVNQIYYFILLNIFLINISHNCLFSVIN